jgi:hypothetical protein
MEALRIVMSVFIVITVVVSSLAWLVLPVVVILDIFNLI